MMLVGTIGGVLQVNCMRRLPAFQSNNPNLSNQLLLGIPRLDERCDCWTTSSAQRPNPFIVPVAQLLPQIPTQREPEAIPRRLHIRRDVSFKVYGYTDGCVVCNTARAGRVQSHTVWSVETRSKVQSCPECSTKFAEATKKRGDAVKEWEHHWSPDPDVLMSYHQAKWVATGPRQSTHAQGQ